MESTASNKHYDFLVVGAGSGGLGAARRAAMFGKKVAMVENNRIGGTCVNVGCVPKKIMFNLANFLEETHLFADYGVKGLDNVQLDFPTFKTNREAYIQRLNGIYHKNVQSSGVEYFQGTAHFLEPKKIQVDGDNKQILTADHVMIASGSKSIVPRSFEGAELCMTSDDVFAMEKLPKSIVVIGGGYIGTEMVNIMQAFGVKSTLIVRDVLLGRVDQEIVDLLIENMKKLGVDVRMKTSTSKVTKDKESGLLNVHLSDGSILETEAVLLALGREPNTDPLGLKEVGIELEKNGAVKVDEW